MQKAGLRLDSPAAATAKLKRGGHAVVPGKADESELVARVYSEAPSERMPPPKAGKELKPQEKELLKRWIAMAQAPA